MAEAVAPEVASGILTPPGYERLTKRSEAKCLRLATGESIELIMGKDHIIRLRRGNDGVVRISIDGFQLPDPEHVGVFLDEVELPANTSVDIRRDSILADNKFDLERMKNYDESLEKRVNDDYINFPNSAVNLHGQGVDFTDIGDGPFSGLSIMIDGRRAGDNTIIITNHDGRFGVAVPVQPPVPEKKFSAGGAKVR